MTWVTELKDIEEYYEIVIDYNFDDLAKYCELDEFIWKLGDYDIYRESSCCYEDAIDRVRDMCGDMIEHLEEMKKDIDGYIENIKEKLKNIEMQLR